MWHISCIHIRINKKKTVPFRFYNNNKHILLYFWLCKPAILVLLGLNQNDHNASLKSLNKLDSCSIYFVLPFNCIISTSPAVLSVSAKTSGANEAWRKNNSLQLVTVCIQHSKGITLIHLPFPAYYKKQFWNITSSANMICAWVTSGRFSEEAATPMIPRCFTMSLNWVFCYRFDKLHVVCLS